jgi:Tol biopolymer transport system component/DNA-binding winged helix-turn-helix (wHTH) protein
MSSPLNNLYEFGPYVLDASERTLRRGDEPVRLTPKEFETLLVLLRGGGRVMSKEELLKEIWPDTFVEEATLAQNVFTLRKALARGDEGGGQHYIETVPRRGYRFAAKVLERETATPTHSTARGNGARSDGDGGDAPRATDERDEPDKQESPAATFPSKIPSSSTATAPSAAPSASIATGSTEGAARPSQAQTGHPVRAAILIAAASLLGFAGLVYAVLRFSVRPETNATTTARPPAFQSMKVTRLPVAGDVQDAVISPDGKYLAYIAPDGGSQSIWVRQVGAASNAQRIVAPAEGIAYGGPLFSPDSRHVFYALFQNRAPSPSLYQVPVLGGPAKQILENIGSPISFSPDGKRFAFLRGGLDKERSLLTANVDGSDERKVLTRTPPAAVGLPAWSPDGKVIACVYSSAVSPNPETSFLGVTVFNVADGAETKLTGERWLNINQLSWLPDGSGLVLNGAEQELSPPQIWQLSFPGGEARRITNDLNSYQGASLTADGSSLVAVQTDRIPNIWVAQGGDAAHARQITFGTGKFDGYYGVSWTPDGRIVYASIAGGSWDIWIMNADGTGQKQLTVGARSNYGPSVSTDGRHIIFVSNRAGEAFNVWRMDIDGANPKQLTSGQGENFAHPTPDGRWVVYATLGAGTLGRIWRVPFEGGEPLPVTDKPASWPFVSPDGKSVACVYDAEGDGQVRLAVVPIEGGPPSRLFDIDLTFRANVVWMPDNSGLAYLDARSGTVNVWLQPLPNGKPVQLTDFNTEGVAAYDWSRDGKQLVATRSVETTGVVLIRDFR